MQIPFRKERAKMLGGRVRKMQGGNKYTVRNVPSSAEMLKRLNADIRWKGPIPAEVQQVSVVDARQHPLLAMD
jgi:hypothetical protein